MLEPEHNDRPSIFRWVVRGFYLLIASFFAIVSLWVDLFPGTTLEERRFRGINGIGGLVLMASMVWAAPLIPYVLWKLFVKRKLPGFWGIAFLVAASPLLLMFLLGIILY
jgi:magnesium-transporting ATPase (P-type)